MLGGAAVAAVLGAPDATRLRAEVAGAGALAPAVFVLAYAAATLAPLPKNVLSAAGGLLFGLVDGTILVLLAATMGAVGAFWLGRVLGRDAVERLAGPRVVRLDQLMRRRGVLAVVTVRLVPVVPFTAVNYASGLTSVRFRDYLVGTVLGIVPGTIAFVALGRYGSNPWTWQFGLSAGVLAALTIGGAAAARRSRRQPQPIPPDPSEG